MRLVNVDTMELEEFFDEQIPPYAILSHRWEKGEVTFQDYLQSRDYGQQEDNHGKQSILLRKKAGFKKITGLCNMARRMSIGYVWIDTCCIDKTSSAELSEAINSMFAWYQNSEVCYAYLCDVVPTTSCNSDPYDRLLPDSKWFDRGWTLQELLAPQMLIFYDKNWNRIGTRFSRARVVSDITGIQARFLRGIGDPVTEAPAAERFSWASRRKTTRTEDMAYCLLGLLDVNMPLLYGEGHKAFRRLQEEFMKTHLDLTLLTWGFTKPPQIYMGSSKIHSRGVGCLASTVSQFHRWNQGPVLVSDPEEHHTNTNAGLLLAVKPREIARTGSFRFGFIPLDNTRRSSCDEIVGSGRGGFILAIPIVWNAEAGGPTKAQRADGNGPFWVPSHASRPPRTVEGTSSIYGRTYLVSPPHIQVVEIPTRSHCDIYYNGVFRAGRVEFDLLDKHGYYLADYYPPGAFESGRSIAYNDDQEQFNLFRFTHSEKRDIFFFKSDHRTVLGDSTLLLGTVPESCTTWEHLLKPDYDKISFQRLRESFFWFSRVRLNNLKHPYRILIDVVEGLDRHSGSSVEMNISFRVIEEALPVDCPEDSENSDNRSVSVETDEVFRTSEF